jgi:hypothetical protein
MFRGFVLGVVAMILVAAACGYAVLRTVLIPANADASIQLAVRWLASA